MVSVLAVIKHVQIVLLLHHCCIESVTVDDDLQLVLLVGERGGDLSGLVDGVRALGRRGAGDVEEERSRGSLRGLDGDVGLEIDKV